MKVKLIFISLLMGLGMTGCRTVAPVSHTLKTETKEDSISTKTESLKDSTNFSEKVTEKTLPEATARVILTTNQADSLSHALGNLPKGAKLVYQDSKLRAQLKIYKDSLNQVHFECTATEQKYNEKNTQQTRYIEKLVNELNKVQKEKKTQEETLLKQKASLWQKIKIGLAVFAFLLLLIVVGVAYGFYKMRLR